MVSNMVAVTKLPLPQTRLPFVNNKLVGLSDQEGNYWACAVNYSGTGKSALFVINPDTGKAERYPFLGERGAYCITPGVDNRLYLGTHSGRLYAFDLKRRTFKRAGCPFPKEEIWGGGSSSNGRIYLGTYPTGSFAEYDVKKKKFTFIAKSPVKNGTYACRFLEMPDGKICIGVGGPQICYLLYDPHSQSMKQFVPEYIRGNTFPRVLTILPDGRVLFSVYPHEEKLYIVKYPGFEVEDMVIVPRKEKAISDVAVSDKIYGAGYPTGNIYYLAGLKWRRVSGESPDMPSRIYPHPEGGIMGITSDGMFFRLDSKRGIYLKSRVDSADRDAMPIQSITKGRQKEIFGSTYINQRIFRINYQTGADKDLGVVTRIGGQVNAMLFFKGKLYLASYTQAVLLVYDPDRPFETDINPYRIGVAGKDQNRPYKMITNGKMVYISTAARYGALGGALIELDPATYKFRCYHNIVPNQNIVSIGVDKKANLIWGGTNIYGEAVLPKEKQAGLFAWDIEKKKKTFQISPSPHTTAVVVGVVLPSHRIIGWFMSHRYSPGACWNNNSDKYFIFDSKKMEFVARGRFPLGKIRCMVLGSDGLIYGLSQKGMFCWDSDKEPDKNSLKLLHTESGSHLVEVEPGLFIYAVGGGLRRVAVRMK